MLARTRLLFGVAGALLMLAPSASAGTFVGVPGSPFAAGKSPHQVAFSPSGGLLATAGSGDGGTISMFSVDAATGKLTQVPGSPFPVSGGGYTLSFSPSGSLIAALGCASLDHGNCFDQVVDVMSVNPSTGALTQVPGSPFDLGRTNAKTLAFSPSGDLLAIGDYGSQYPAVGSVLVFSVNPSTGQLTQVPGSPFAAGGHPQAIAFSPSGNLLATANQTDDSVSLLSVDATTGRMTPVAGSPWKVGGEPASVSFSPSGGLVATADIFDGKVSVFSVDAATSGLSEVPGSPFTATDVLALAFSPSGNFLATANAGAYSPTVFSVDPTTGALTEMGAPPATHASADSVAFSPSSDLLATANEGGSVSVLRYQATGGAATPATVAKSLAVAGSAASITKLLRTGKVSLPVSAPVPGHERIVWQSERHHHVLTVGSGSQTFKSAGKAKLVIHVSRAGRALLRHTSRIALTAVGTFTPTVGKPVTAHRKIHLHR